MLDFKKRHKRNKNMTTLPHYCKHSKIASSAERKMHLLYSSTGKLMFLNVKFVFVFVDRMCF